jgi:hypothetical protein
MLASANSLTAAHSTRGLLLREDRGGIAALDGATLKDLAEGIDSFGFQAIGEHRTPPSADTTKQTIERFSW